MTQEEFDKLTSEEFTKDSATEINTNIIFFTDVQIASHFLNIKAQYKFLYNQNVKLLNDFNHTYSQSMIENVEDIPSIKKQIVIDTVTNLLILYGVKQQNKIAQLWFNDLYKTEYSEDDFIALKNYLEQNEFLKAEPIIPTSSQFNLCSLKVLPLVLTFLLKLLSNELFFDKNYFCFKDSFVALDQKYHFSQSDWFFYLFHIGSYLYKKLQYYVNMHSSYNQVELIHLLNQNENFFDEIRRDNTNPWPWDDEDEPEEDEDEDDFENIDIDLEEPRYTIEPYVTETTTQITPPEGFTIEDV